MFLFREALGRDPGDLSGYEVSRRGARVPTVLSRPECQRLFEALEGTTRLMAELMYGSGLRLTELLRLRVKDADLERRQLVVRSGKGDKDRVTVLPESLVERLRAHRDRVRELHEGDRGDTGWPGCGSRRRWNASIRVRGYLGSGFGSFPRARSCGTRIRGCCGATMCWMPPFNWPFVKRPEAPGNLEGAVPFVSLCAQPPRAPSSASARGAANSVRRWTFGVDCS